MIVLTLDELADKYKVTKATIYKWRRNGMPILKIGKVCRYDIDAVDKWVRDQQKGLTMPQKVEIS